MLKRYKEGQKNMLDTLLSNTAFTVTKNPILNDKLKSQYLQLVLELWPSKAQPSFSHSHPESNRTPKGGMKGRKKRFILISTFVRYMNTSQIGKYK